MATASYKESNASVKVVTKFDECQAIVDEILASHSVIAVGAKGLILEQRGPITLLQIGINSGDVYLFDVHTNKNLLTQGRLKDLLNSKNIVKIMHSGRWARASLRQEYSITLGNVFDTQIAHLELEKFKGRRLPDEAELTEICDLYDGNSIALATTKIVKNECAVKAAYWGIRPLTPKMKEYAAASVQVFFDVHENQLRQLQQAQLYPRFFGLVKRPFRVESEREETVETILTEIDEKFRDEVYLSFKFLNTDERKALELSSVEQVQGRLCLEWLRRKSVKRFLKRTEKKINRKPKFYDFSEALFNKLRSDLKTYKDPATEESIKDVLRLFKKLQLEQICRKYDVDTPLSVFRVGDIQAIRNINVKRETNLTLLALYERICIKDLRDILQEHARDPANVTVPIGFSNRIRFHAKNGNKFSKELHRLSIEAFGKL